MFTKALILRLKLMEEHSSCSQDPNTLDEMRGLGYTRSLPSKDITHHHTILTSSGQETTTDGEFHGPNGTLWGGGGGGREGGGIDYIYIDL